MVSVWRFWQVSWHKTYLPVGRQVPDALWQGANGVLPRVLHIQASRHQNPHEQPAHSPILLASWNKALCPASKDPSASVSDELRQDLDQAEY